MSTFHVYLNLPGTTDSAFEFYSELFGAQYRDRYTYRDMAAHGVDTQPKHADLIAHAALELPNMLLMSSDSEEPVQQTKGNSVIFLHYAPDSIQDADRVFEALASGGEVIMPIDHQPWGYNGRCIDRFGVAWEVLFDTELEPDADAN
ncbi:VOC family protein [Corynebacterium freiburgense]|uniref:VOC family protein n=1 Tax=Corynebacterium freiburgense TaxID=556548 RepID=UPI0004135D86|nr:VOC family protein [Corynebacterium freiburgense]WJZ03230.1 hypothetical protein CFREI_09760 [Corynebacterium freiburgense]